MPKHPAGPPGPKRPKPNRARDKQVLLSSETHERMTELARRNLRTIGSEVELACRAWLYLPHPSDVAAPQVKE